MCPSLWFGGTGWSQAGAARGETFYGMAAYVSLRSALFPQKVSPRTTPFTERVRGRVSSRLSAGGLLDTPCQILFSPPEGVVSGMSSSVVWSAATQDAKASGTRFDGGRSRLRLSSRTSPTSRPLPIEDNHLSPGLPKVPRPPATNQYHKIQTKKCPLQRAEAGFLIANRLCNRRRERNQKGTSGRQDYGEPVVITVRNLSVAL
jgi:hypothetical protein